MDKLIDQMARAIYGISPAIQPWDGDPFGFDEPRAQHERERAIKQAKAAFEALELVDTNWYETRQNGDGTFSHVIVERWQTPVVDRLT